MRDPEELPGEQPLATPDLEDALSGQEMNHMPECLRAPPQTIRRNGVPTRKILVPGLLAQRKGLEYGSVRGAHKGLSLRQPNGPGLNNVMEHIVQGLGHRPLRIVALKSGQIADIADVIS
jgi:hypothetical protein